MTFSELLTGELLHPVGGFMAPQATAASDVVTDALSAGADTVFVACVTAIYDGHDMALTAYQRGCRHFVAERLLPLPSDAALLLTPDTREVLGELASRVQGYPARSLTVVGITGTHGKTATALLAAALLTGSGRKVALLTTDGTDIGDSFSPAGEIAPDAADLARFFRRAVAAGAEIAIVELSAYMLAHGATKGTPFTVVLCTDLAPRHIGKGEHADIAAYRAAKARLLGADAPVAILPVGLADFTPRGRVLRYGVGEIDADFRVAEQGTHTVGSVEATSAVFYDGDAAYPIETPLFGVPYLHNLTAALALATILGEQPARLAGLTPAVRAAGRLDCICPAGGRRVCFDAAYEAEDLVTVLTTLRGVTKGKLSVLLGSVGGRAYARRAPLGAAALAGADFVYFTEDDRNGESARQIALDMVGENADSARYLVMTDRAAAIAAAVLDLRRGDTLLILGKPREETQLVHGKKQFFSDRRAVLDAIRDF